MALSDLSPISELKKKLDATFPDEPWPEFEVETIFIEADIPPTVLCREKVNLLRVIAINPELFYEDFLFFLHATEVCNNKVTNFDYVPDPTSLEIAFAITDMAKTLGVSINESPSFSEGVIAAITRCLTNEGYSFPVYPFDTVGITSLVAGQLPQDTKNKEKAINAYVNSTYSQSTN